MSDLSPSHSATMRELEQTRAERDALAARVQELEAAIGPVGNVKRVAAQLPDCTSYSLAALANWMTAVADAAVPDNRSDE